MFKESLANALYDPTVDLALEQEWVDGATESSTTVYRSIMTVPVLGSISTYDVRTSEAK